MLISESYRALNRRAHEEMPNYGTVGRRWAPYVRRLAARIDAKTILDYGSGKGTLAMALPDHAVSEYDPAIPGKDDPPEPADLVVCTDVLEHVEGPCTDAVLEHILTLAGRGVLLVISCRVGSKRLADGKPAHRNVMPPEKWRRKLGQIGRWKFWMQGPHELVALLIRPGDHG